MKNKILTLLLIVLGLYTNAQVVVPDPAFPSHNLPLEVIFNALEGNAGLANYTGDVYAHTGVITNLSSGPGDWKYVKTDWGQNSPETMLERLGANQYKFTTGTQSIRQFYGVPESEEILQVAFVFRSGALVSGDYLEGKTEEGGDIFVNVYPEGLFIRINSPQNYASLLDSGETILLEAESNYADSVFLYVNDVMVVAEAGNVINHTLIAEDSGKHYIRVMAKQNEQVASDTAYYFIRMEVVTQPLPENTIDGINYINDSTVVLSLYAPGKDNVFVIGDFNNWEYTENHFMNATPDGNRFWAQITGLIPQKEYIFQYMVDEQILIGDPYAEKVSDPWNDRFIPNSVYPDLIEYPHGKTSEIATVLQTAQEPYIWNTTQFTPPAKTDLVIYELLVRDFLAGHNYQLLIDTLTYLKRLGVNAIELMPVNEFEGNSSWGYNPAYYFAPDKYYGTKNDLKEFIDICHQNGIAVIVDVVLNHVFGSSPFARLYWNAALNRPATNNPWLNPVPKHDYNVGYDFNHDSPATKYLVDRVVKHWINEYNIDGYRFDLSKGFTQKNTLGNVGAWGQYDASRVALWKDIADTIWSINPAMYVILEHFADNSEEKELANYGMMLWGNLNHAFRQSVMGYSDQNDFSSLSYKQRGWNNPHLIGYMESHDEERLMYSINTWGNMGNPAYNIKNPDTAVNRIAMATAFFYSVPGPKMLWQFGELAYDYSIDYNGRTGEKPIRWDYMEDYRRAFLYNFTATMIKLKQEHEVFRTTDYSTTFQGFTKKLNLRGSEMSVVVIGNFGINEAGLVPGFNQTGKWYEYFTADSITVNSLTDEVTLKAGEFKLYTTKKLAHPETGLGYFEGKASDNTILGDVFPNPSRGTIYIPLKLTKPESLTISIYNSSGKLVKQIPEEKLSTGEHILNVELQGSAPGMHLLRLETSSEAETTKFIIR